MYVPRHFRVSDPEELQGFIEAHGFATLVSNSATGPLATHLPLMLDRDAGDHGTLIGHMARSNPHWHVLESAEPTLAMFLGPHAYISPAWYVAQPALPTWNYSAVHAYGRPTLIEDSRRVGRLLDELVEVYESGRSAPWSNDLPAEFRAKMEKGVVAFELSIERIEGKFKLSQNRSAADQRSALEGLASEGGGCDLVEFWSRLLPPRGDDS
jgi:transcriptional regulator